MTTKLNFFNSKTFSGQYTELQYIGEVTNSTASSLSDYINIIASAPLFNANYTYKFTCSQDYYGTDCSVYCVPTNDSSGHYSCGSNGDKICLPGYINSSANCIQDNCTVIESGICSCVGSDIVMV